MEESPKAHVGDPALIDRVPADVLDPYDSAAELASLQPKARAWWQRIHVGKISLFIASLLLFILAINLMKEGARGVAPLVRNLFSVTNVANSLGFGWLFAYAIMSGSPVAAAALTFFDASVLNRLQAFAMIAGSRLGASFIVLFIGFLYVLRGRDRTTSLSMGLLSLTVTATTYVPGLFLGAILLNVGVLDGLQLHSGALLSSTIDVVIDPIANLLSTLLPEWAVFLVGLGIILLSFNLFDRCLPEMTIKESQVGRMSRLVYRPAVMFALGALVTVISMSVTLSLSILVPLSSRGFVRRENVIPYIMGANITTFVDTLLAAVLLNNPAAFTIVFVEMFSITCISLVILITNYRFYQETILRFVGWITVSNRNLAVFMIGIFTVPIILMFV
jgi:sodium-dependent phosphate cotransporter